MSLAVYTLLLFVKGALREFYKQRIVTEPNKELALVPNYRRDVTLANQ